MNTKLLSIAALALLFTLGLTACEKGPAEKAGENIDNAVEEMGDKIENATDNASESVEAAGDKIEDKTDH